MRRAILSIIALVVGSANCPHSRCLAGQDKSTMGIGLQVTLQPPMYEIERGLEAVEWIADKGACQKASSLGRYSPWAWSDLDVDLGIHLSNNGSTTWKIGVEKLFECYSIQFRDSGDGKTIFNASLEKLGAFTVTPSGVRYTPGEVEVLPGNSTTLRISIPAGVLEKNLETNRYYLLEARQSCGASTVKMNEWRPWGCFGLRAPVDETNLALRSCFSGMRLASRGDTEAAEKVFLEGIRDSQSFACFYRQLVLLRIKQKRFKEGLLLIEQAEKKLAANKAGQVVELRGVIRQIQKDGGAVNGTW